MTGLVEVSLAASDNNGQEALRARIGWICHAIRIAALAYAGWIFIVLIVFWSSDARVADHFGRLSSMAVAGTGAGQRLGGFAVGFVVWSMVAAACFSLWRLFGLYLTGRIFTIDSALWLRRIALFGLAALIIDVAARPLVSAIVSAHLPSGQRFVTVYFLPNDLLNGLFLVSLLALAHIFKTAAAIADDNRQIV